MKIRLALFLLAVTACLSGCIAYRTGQLQEVGANKFDASTMLRDKPSCVISHRLNIQSIPTCVSISPDRLAFDQQGTVVRSLSGSGLFRSCTLHVQGDDATDIRLNSTCTFTWSEFGGEIPLGALSLSLYPARMHEYRFDFSFTARRSDGLLRQYEFSESVVDRVGIFLLAVAPFLSEGSYAESFEAVNRLAVSHLLSRMQQDGFFSAEGRDKAAAAKADVVEAAKKTVAARRKELEDLKKAGIIDEAEFASEVKKLEGIKE